MFILIARPSIGWAIFLYADFFVLLIKITLMITITQFDFTSDLYSINLVFNSTSPITDLVMYLGDGYTGDPIDLSAKLTGATSYDFSGINALSATDLGLPEGTPLAGIFIVNITNSDITPEIEEAGILSDYFLVLCLANKVITQNQESDLNETTFLFLLLEAIKSYMAEEQLEQAIGAYDRAEAICEADPDSYTTDILPRGEGTGCWIIDGVYIVKK